MSEAVGNFLLSDWPSLVSLAVIVLIFGFSARNVTVRYKAQVKRIEDSVTLQRQAVESQQRALALQERSNALQEQSISLLHDIHTSLKGP